MGRLVDADHVVHQNFGVGLLAQDGADGLGDIGRGQDGERHLIEQGLERVMIAPIDDGHIHRELGESDGCVKATKAAAYDDYTRPPARRLLQRFGQFAQNASPRCASHA